MQKLAGLEAMARRVAIAVRALAVLSLGRDWIVVRLVVFVLGLASSNQVEAGAPTMGMRFEHVSDLTHTLDGAFPYMPVPGITFPVQAEADRDVRGKRGRRQQLGNLRAPGHADRCAEPFRQGRSLARSRQMGPRGGGQSGQPIDGRSDPLIGATKVRAATGGLVCLIAMW
jgi:hypothetical protein